MSDGVQGATERGSARLCLLHQSLGTTEPCPGPRCSLWEEGGAVLGSECAVERLGVDVRSRPDLAFWLLELREGLESATRPEEASQAWARYRAALAGDDD